MRGSAIFRSDWLAGAKRSTATAGNRIGLDRPGRAVNRLRLARRGLVSILLALAGRPLPSGAGQSPVPTAIAPAESRFSFATVRERARQRAATEYRPEPNRLPQFLKGLGYDNYQMIRFRPEAGPWAEESGRFSLQFFHPGYLYQNPVAVHLVDQGRVTAFQFSPAQFDYGRNHFPKPMPADLQFPAHRRWAALRGLRQGACPGGSAAIAGRASMGGRPPLGCRARRLVLGLGRLAGSRPPYRVVAAARAAGPRATAFPARVEPQAAA